jgi:nitrous oxidase accessory protein
MKKLVAIPALFIFLMFFGRTIPVGKGQIIKSLRQAIKSANAGDTIALQKGVYKEGNIILTKSLTILGIENPVLDGENKFETLTISGKNILVKGITFRNSGYSAMNDYAAIKIIDASHITIQNNTILNAYFGIHVSNSTYVVIRRNTINGLRKTEQLSGNGIHLWKSSHALIDGNRIQGQRDGIYFEFVSFSTVQNNVSENNIRYGIHFMFSNDDIYFNNLFRKNAAGVAVMYSKKVNMEWNRFEENWGSSSYGILLKEITDSYIQHNSFIKNTAALHLEGTNRIEIKQNLFKENGWAIRVQASCQENNFYNNNFIGNSFDVSTNGTMVLNKFYNNYWDKYEGYDMNKDGVGDVPYHPVSLYSMIIDENPASLILMRSFMVNMLDRAEKAIPSITPENLVDDRPLLKPNKL